MCCLENAGRWIKLSIKQPLCSRRHIGWVPRSQNNVFKAISLSLRTMFFFWGVFVYNVIYSHVPWILMKGVVNLRDLQSLGKSQQHLFVCGQFHLLGFLMGSELDLANQDEQNRIRMSLGFSARLGFVFCLLLLKSAGVELGLLQHFRKCRSEQLQTKWYKLNVKPIA